MDILINIGDVNYITDLGNIHYVFWHGIFVGSIEKLKKKKYMPPELVGKRESGYTSNEYYDTKEQAAIAKIKKYLNHHPDRIDGPKEDDLEKSSKFKSGIEFLKKMRTGDYGPELNIIKQELEKWCIANNVGQEKFRFKIVESFLFFIMGSRTWPVTENNQKYSEYIRSIIYDFLKYLLIKGISLRTFRQHADNLSMLAVDILQKRSVIDINVIDWQCLFLQDIQKSCENPPDYGYRDVEEQRKRFQLSCKKIVLYVKQTNTISFETINKID